MSTVPSLNSNADRGDAARSSRTLAGPRALPFLGNAPEFVRGGVPHRQLERWADEHGPTYRLRLGPRNVVVTADPAHVDLILRRRPHDFRRARSTSSIVDELVRPGAFTAEGDHWRRLRKVATQSLSPSYLRQYFDTVTMVTGRLLRRWEAFAASGERIDVLDQTTRYTLDVAVGLAMGHDLNSLENSGDGLHTRLPALLAAFSQRLMTPIPYWRLVKLPRDRRLDATVREVEALVRGRYEGAKARVEAGEQPSNFLEALVRPLDDVPEITESEVLGNVFTMLLAGSDTTSSAAGWALHFLAEHPEIHEKVRAEADEVLGERELPADPAAMGRLQYAEAVVNEALRLRPPIPFLGFEPTRNLSITGSDGRELSLAADEEVFLLLSYGGRRDAERFPAPGVFSPERWLEGKPADGKLPFVPFGAGPRFCPGRNLALIETSMVTSVLARTFDFTPDRSAGAVVEGLSFAMIPKNLYLRVSPR
ncbi:cytochrome P450 [Actinoplanes sp. NBRC 103695]|uniref:cytochrome P450 n=1 Tax=Actinoplanes sp. NBRC 103695 TaxID=3032202 RepID=UPI0024A52E12|nr:cytochrome P450 [Actinoplanes sp. NBRC 103695]GLZ02413.1 Epi-isozizaene 5-monooxygenase/(E)-beta-farnesene synthase [Actinoplanes sp. NBRC 103695]